MCCTFLCFAFPYRIVSVYITHLIFPLYDGAHFPCVCVCVCRSDACVMLCGSASACTLSVCLSGFEIARSFVRSFVRSHHSQLTLPYPSILYTASGNRSNHSNSSNGTTTTITTTTTTTLPPELPPAVVHLAYFVAAPGALQGSNTECSLG